MPPALDAAGQAPNPSVSINSPSVSEGDGGTMYPDVGWIAGLRPGWIAGLVSLLLLVLAVAAPDAAAQTRSLSIDSPSVTEGDSGSKNLTFTVTLSAVGSQQVTVDWAEGTSGTATSGTDYTAITGGTLTFAAGTTSQTFNVSVTGDALDEANETIVVTLSSPTNATLATASRTGTITHKR